jgi:hypothetical protein
MDSSGTNVTENSNKSIRWIEIPIECFLSNDASILDQLYQLRDGHYDSGNTDDFLALPRPTFPPKPTSTDDEVKAANEVVGAAEEKKERE